MTGRVSQKGCEKARAHIAEARRRNAAGATKDAIQWLKAAAKAYAEDGQHSRALAVLTSALEIRDLPKIRWEAASYCMEVGSKSDALHHLEAARRTYAARQDITELEVVLRKMVQLSPHDPRFVKQLGHLLQARGEAKLAERLLERARDLEALIAESDFGPDTNANFRIEQEMDDLRAGLLADVGLRAPSAQPQGWVSADSGPSHDLVLDDYVQGMDFDIDLDSIS